MKNLFRIIVLVLFYSLHSQVIAQQSTTNDGTVSITTNRKTTAPFAIKFANKAFDQKDIIFTEYLGYRTGIDRLEEVSVISTKGLTTHRYKQFFGKIPVEHGSYTIVEKENMIQYMMGDFYEVDRNYNITPAIDENTALIKALNSVSAQKYKWEIAGEELFIKKETGDPAATFYPKGELVLVENFENKTEELDGKLHLAFKFDVYAHEPHSRHHIYVDANTGEILFKENRILDCHSGETAQENLPGSAIATADSRYSGTVNMPTKFVGASYRLEAELATEGYPLHTFDMNNGTNYGNAVEITDADNNWTAAEFPNATYDNAALDAHWGAAVVYDYWKTEHNRFSYDDNNAVILSYVHFNVNYNNASWDGSRMTYGDGSNSPGGFTPLTGLDVCGHEVAHAVCTYTCNLAYERESGALNEAFSDIWGAATEHKYDPMEVDGDPKDHFLIGEEITFNAGSALRSMNNPNQFGDPDTYHGTNWANATVAEGCTNPTENNDYCGVHTNSGVLNFWFYLLVTGGSGTNDLGDNYSVTGIGWADAQAVVYQGEISLTATSNYAACRVAMINAAIALFGDCSANVEAVTNAFYAVGVGPIFGSCNPVIMFVNANINVSETGIIGGDCLKTKTINVAVNLSGLPSETVFVLFNITGTASSGLLQDYTLANDFITFPTGSYGNSNLVFTINDDAIVEGTETIIISIQSIITTGNAQAATINQTCTINILDDDHAPEQGSTLANQTIFTDNFTAGQGMWSVQNNTENANQIWRFGFNLGTNTYFTSSNNCAYFSRNSTSFSYNTTTGNCMLVSLSINTSNIFNVNLTFEFVCNGELDSGVYYDYGTLWYSTDNGLTWLPINNTKYTGITTKTMITVPLPSGASNNTSLKLGFLWINDGGVQHNPPFGVDNIVVKGDIPFPSEIESTLVTSDERYLGPNNTVYFYNPVNDNILAKIQNNTAHDYGCTIVEVDRTGSSAQYVTGDISGNNLNKISDKTFKVIPENNSSDGNYTITLYYTEDEKNGFETATGRTWIEDNGGNNGIKILKYPGSISNINANTGGGHNNIVDVGIFNSDGYTASGNFSAGFSGFAIGVPPALVLPVNVIDFNCNKINKEVLVSWKVGDEDNVDYYQIERSSDGKYFEKIGTVQASRSKEYKHTDIHPLNGINYYRIKIVDNDNKFDYTVIKSVNFSQDSDVTIYPNPTTGIVKISSGGIIQSITVLDQKGLEVYYIKNVNSNETSADLNDLLPAVYTVQIVMKDGTVQYSKLIKTNK